jgi:PD-(D/E)XK endonuclease
MGCDVSIPLTESAAYDLIVDTGSGLQRVQCKFCSTPEVDLRRIHSNSTGYVEKRVPKDAYDWLYVLRPDGSEFLIQECHPGRRSITPRPDHRLGAATL